MTITALQQPTPNQFQKLISACGNDPVTPADPPESLMNAKAKTIRNKYKISMRSTGVIAMPSLRKHC